ncbi:hypothetical protein Hanom_Chr11g01060211 [Helianthus anomalus]
MCVVTGMRHATEVCSVVSVHDRRKRISKNKPFGKKHKPNKTTNLQLKRL